MTRAPWRAVVVGGGSLTIECAERLRRRGHEVVAVVTDAPAVASWATDAGLLHVPLGDASGADWGLEPVDYLFSIVNLRVLGPAALALARRAAINFHDGPLPQYGGLHVTSWAIAAGETDHAVTWHLMRHEVDAGDVLLSSPVPIPPDATAQTLNAACFEAGIASFEVLIEGLEAGTVEPTPQAPGPRALFTRAHRPALGGVLDLRADAARLAALGRALTFGPHPNALGLPALAVGDAAVVAARIDALDGAADVAPGTYLGTYGAGLRFRAGDRDVRVATLRLLSGTELGPDEAAAALGLVPGRPIAAPDEAAVAAFERAIARWARHEEGWTSRLERLELLPTPLVGPPVSAPGDGRAVLRQPLEDATVDGLLATSGAAVAEGDALLAAVAAFFARLAAAAGGDVAFRHPALPRVAGAAAPRFASHVPITVAKPASEPFAAYFERFEAERAATVERGGFTRDLPLRMPSLSTLEPAWAAERWPLTLERVGTLDAATDDGAPGAGLSVIIPDDGRALAWRHDPARVAPALVERLQAQLAAFLDDLARAVPVSEASVLSRDDLADLRGWNATATALPPEETIHDAIAAQARRTPTRAAVLAGRTTLSYAALDERANRLARLLARRGVRPGDRVGVLADRDADLVVALLAILKAGAAYVPLDPEFPADRLAFMVEDAELTLVVAHRHTAPAAPVEDERLLVLGDAESALAAEDADAPDAAVARADLAYVIYTSGSTGRPKGVMLEHGNVLNFMAGMDAHLRPGADPGTWLAVTSISFDISVLELLWTLARGFTVVLYAGDDRRRPAARQAVAASPPASAAAGAATPASAPAHVPAGARDGAPARDDTAPLELSLFYFSSDADDEPDHRYRLLLEGARFADAHGFAAVWTPERHFHAFGGLFPNPAVAGAAVAAITERVRIRAGSCVLPLHHPIRVAEEWAVVDNLSGGRVDVSFAAGWQPDDFVLAPANHAERNEVMARGIETVRALWRGEARTFDGPDGRPVAVRTLPRPVQPELPFWVTAAGNPATFRSAGAMGANLLTHLLGQDLIQLEEKVRGYREAWSAAGHPGRGHVSLMLHTFVGPDPDAVRATVREPLRGYLQSSAALMRTFASSFPAFRGTDAGDAASLDAAFQGMSESDLDALLEHAYERYYATSGLFGTVDEALATADRVRAADIDEIACLIDFGIPTDAVLEGLHDLAELKDALTVANAPSTLPDLVARHGVTHLQCTPSMAQMLVADAAGREALGSLELMLVGGEALPRELARTLAALVPGEVVNVYGPTETTVWSTVQPLSGESGDGEAPVVAIGTPIANTEAYVCDEALQPLPADVPGELVLGGMGVSRGYWRRPEITAERFVPDRISAAVGVAPALVDGRLYRTGDLARRGSDGTLSYLGRLDFQVKVRGHRIELGEIEAVLDEHPLVRQAVVVARPGTGGDARLVAYVVPAGSVRPRAAALRDHAAARLPAPMVPDAYVVLEAFPLTPNRKVDRRALPEPVADDRDRDGDYVAPSGDREVTLAEVWRHVLSVERVGAHDDFFALGGNSLLAVFATTEVAKRGYRMTLAQLLAAPTIAGLAPRLTSLASEGQSEGAAGRAVSE